MNHRVNDTGSGELEQLCGRVRAFAAAGHYEVCIPAICSAMERYPHAPQPHNLLGIILEKLGDHLTAMKHFRAAWALDPTYLPANHNLNTYGTFRSMGSCAFDESDLLPTPSNHMEIKREKRDPGRIVYQTIVEYDKHGIGHVVRR